MSKTQESKKPAVTSVTGKRSEEPHSATRAPLHPPAGFAENRRTEEIPRIRLQMAPTSFSTQQSSNATETSEITWLLWELYYHTESKLTHLGSFLKEPERDLLSKCRFLKKSCCKGHPIQSTSNSDNLYLHCITTSLAHHSSRLSTDQSRILAKLFYGSIFNTSKLQGHMVTISLFKAISF